MVMPSCGEVKGRLSRGLSEGLPAIDPAHGDLAGGHERPEQHGRGFRVGHAEWSSDFSLWLKADQNAGPAIRPLCPGALN